MKRLALALFWSTLVIARPAAASEMTTPIEQLNGGLLQAMKAGKESAFQQRYDLLAPLVLRAVDLDIILQGGVGTAWASLPADQQAALKTAFQRYSIATYVAHFDEFAGERFELAAPVGGAQLVRVKIVPGKPGDETHTLSYVMRSSAGGWKAVDVTADSAISQVVTQQDEIHSVFTRGGVNGLLARLQQKTAELSTGTVR